MSQSAYQPGYTITPKYGQRYMNSSFAPSVGAPQSAAVSQPSAPPQPAGQGYGMANPFAGNAQFTQAQQNYSTNIGAQPTVGFRRAIPGTPGAGPSTPPVGTVPGMPAPPSTSPSGTVQAASSGGDDSASTDFIPSAERLGYTRGNANPLGGVLAMVPGGSLLSEALDLNKNYTFGSYGTYDAKGNVFGPDGRAYNPETGRPAQSYASSSSYLGNYLGVGTPEGVLGSSSSYGKLRAAGEDIPNSLLGSYDDSVYKQMDYNPNLNVAGARAARYSNPTAPMGTIADQMAIRAQIARGDYTGLSDDDIDRMGDPNAPKFGYGAGDYAATNFGLGQRNESGTISLTDSYGNPSGTVVAISDSTNPGQNISLLSKNAQTQLRANQELDNRASRGKGGMAGFNVSDGQGGSYQTDSSGTGNWNTGGPTGLDDEYDDGPAMPTKAEIEASKKASCFPEGTQISMVDGTTKNIKDIVVGDKVISFNADNKLEEDEVTELHIHDVGTGRPTDKLVKVLLLNGKEVIVTSNHPFYMPEHNAFKWIGEFKKGELVMAENSLMYPVISVEEISDVNQVVYNFEVKNNHTYIAEGIRVHNGSGKSDDNGGNK